MITRSLEQVAALSGGRLLGEPQAGTAVTSVTTDSRTVTPGAVFVAIAGERTDGHAHLGQVARAHGAAAIVSDLRAARASLESAEAPSQLPLILVEDTVEALGALARGHLADLRSRARDRGENLTVVAMTGSVGKTTTKDLTRQLLATVAPTVAPVASYNNEIGLPLTVLQADEQTRYLVLEMGASGPGHIAYLTDIAPLDAAAVLMIGHAHMGGFGSVEGVAQAKAEILAGLRPGGTAVLNLDDPRSIAMRDLTSAKVLSFSAAGDPDAAVRATEVDLDEQAHAVFTLHLPGLEHPQRVRLALPGAHNVTNALAAAGLAVAAGASPQAVAGALGQARAESPHRMDVLALTLPGKEGTSQRDLLLIDDSYNANIDSMAAALHSLPALAGSRRGVVVVSEMLELGESSDSDHRRVGELAAEVGAALLITVGAGARPAAQAAADRGLATLVLADVKEALSVIAAPDGPLEDGDTVLVKGSHDSGAWRVADHLKEVSRR